MSFVSLWSDGSVRISKEQREVSVAQMKLPERTITGNRIGLVDSARVFISALLLWRIWYTFGKRDFAMRFRRMRLGVAWQFITLALLLVCIGMIYSQIFKQDVKSFLVFLSCSLILWFYLTASMDAGCYAFVGSEGYIKQLPVPPLTYAFRGFMGTTLAFLLQVPAFFVVKLVFQRTFWWDMLWAIPGLLLFSIAACLHGAILAYLNARIRDFQPAVSALMQLMFYVTPIIITPAQLDGIGHPEIYLYNPQYHLLNIVRGPLLQGGGPPLLSWAVTLGLIGFLLLVLLLLIGRYDRRIVYYL